MKSPHSVFAPITWRHFGISSRIVLAPINTGFTRNSRPSMRMMRFHVTRASSSVGIVIVGNVAISPKGVTNPHNALLYSDADVPRLAVIARGIRRAGSVPGIQIAYALQELNPARKWKQADPAGEIKRLSFLITALPEKEIDRSLEAFVGGAVLAARAGFDVIQVHAAHGYFLGLLLNPQLNRRADRFRCKGGWFEEFVLNLKTKLPRVLLSMRMSAVIGFGDIQKELENAKSVAGRLSEAGVDLVDISGGLYTLDRSLIYPGPHVGDVRIPYLDVAQSIARSVKCLVCFAGNVRDIRLLPDDLPGNLLIGIGRALIADPAFAEKSSKGEFSQINQCERYNECHYFSRGLSELECGVNLSLGKADEK